MASARIQLVIGGAEKSGTSSLKHHIGEHPAVSMHAQVEIMHFALDDQHALGFDHARNWYYPDASGVLAGKSVAAMHLDRASERLRDHNPEVRVVLVLRNPVDRAYSAYWHARRRGREHLETFEAALDAEERRRTANGTSSAHRLLYRQRGRYVPQIERLMERFPDTLDLYLLEDLDADPVRICQSV